MEGVQVREGVGDEGVIEGLVECLGVGWVGSGHEEFEVVPAILFRSSLLGIF